MCSIYWTKHQSITRAIRSSDKSKVYMYLFKDVLSSVDNLRRVKFLSIFLSFKNLSLSLGYALIDSFSWVQAFLHRLFVENLFARPCLDPTSTSFFIKFLFSFFYFKQHETLKNTELNSLRLLKLKRYIFLTFAHQSAFRIELSFNRH